MKTHERENLTSDTISRLRMCGHFLHYRMGGRAGRRRILVTMSKHSELLQKDLQDMLGIQSGSLSEMIIKLEGEGLVEKVRSESDSRRLVLRLTAVGKAEAEKLDAEYRSHIRQLFTCFSDWEISEFNSMLNTLTKHWTEVERNWEAEADDEKIIEHK